MRTVRFEVVAAILFVVVVSLEGIVSAGIQRHYHHEYVDALPPKSRPSINKVEPSSHVRRRAKSIGKKNLNVGIPGVAATVARNPNIFDRSSNKKQGSNTTGKKQQKSDRGTKAPSTTKVPVSVKSTKEPKSSKSSKSGSAVPTPPSSFPPTLSTGSPTLPPTDPAATPLPTQISTPSPSPPPTENQATPVPTETTDAPTPMPIVVTTTSTDTTTTIDVMTTTPNVATTTTSSSTVIDTTTSTIDLTTTTNVPPTTTTEAATTTDQNIITTIDDTTTTPDTVTTTTTTADSTTTAVDPSTTTSDATTTSVTEIPTESPSASRTELPTQAPTINERQVSVSPFRVNFALQSSDIVDDTDFLEAGAIVEEYLMDFVKQFFDFTNNFEVESVVLETTGTSSDGSNHQIDYIGSVVFTENSDIPSRAELDQIVEQALQLPAVQTLILLLQNNLSDNPFSTTQTITYQNLSPGQAPDSSPQIGTILGAVLLCLSAVVAGRQLMRRRSQHVKRREEGKELEYTIPIVRYTNAMDEQSIGGTSERSSSIGSYSRDPHEPFLPPSQSETVEEDKIEEIRKKLSSWKARSYKLEHDVKLTM